MRKFFLLLIMVISACNGIAQQVRPADAARLYTEVCRLKHLTNVLYVAAHPDDENTRLLAWLVNEKHVRTAYLSLTRGDGGQNILGSEQGEALGLIRTHELMEARKIDGAEQFFTRAIDFGFSKNYQETFKHWDENLLTGDVVWIMRKFRPDVVICRFPPDKRAGHGHHAASAILAAKAFKVTGDKSAYPQQLQYYAAWQPARLLFNAYHFGNFSTVSDDMFKLRVGQYMPLFGMSSGEMAGLSRSSHKSQGAGTPGVPGIQTEYFQLVAGDSISESLFDGIDITWNRVGREDIGKDIQKIIENFNLVYPSESLPALLKVRKKIETVTDDYWRQEKLTEINKVILDCSGFLAELYAKQPQATAGETLPFTLHVIARAHIPVLLTSIQWLNHDTTLSVNINNDTLLTFEHNITIPANTPVMQPYWLSEPPVNGGTYAIPNDTLLGLPETPDNLNAIITLNMDGENIKVKVPLSYKKLDPVKGDVVEQLRIVPGATVAFTNNLYVTRPDGAVDVGVRLHAFKNISNAMLKINGDNNATAAFIKNIDLKDGGDTIIPIHITTAIIKKMNKGDISLTAVFGTDISLYTLNQHLIQYSHIPTLQYFTPASAKVLQNNWKCTVKRIGYINGAGDHVAEVLRQAGLEVDILKDGDLTNAAKLKKYDAIVTGIRAVNVEKKMSYWMPVLLQYVHNGGTLVMQYNTLQDLSTTQVGPYPLTLSTERVTEEDTKVNFVDPKSRLLNYPNKITDADFADWVQERGLYFASKWDSKYSPLFEMNDTGEQPLKGATLYTKYGKGNYIYTALSFSRQLPNGNRGAIKLFMNMLSVGK